MARTTDWLKDIRGQMAGRIGPDGPDMEAVARARRALGSTCELCKGTGQIKLVYHKDGWTYARAQEYARVSGFPEYETCTCGITRARYMLQTGLSSVERQLSWEDIKDVDGSNLAAVRAVFGQILDGAAGGGLMLYGTYGTGKTLLLKVVTNIMANHLGEGQARYQNWNALYRDMIGAYDTGQREFNRTYQEWVNVPALCLDEVQMQGLTEASRRILFDFLDDRYNRQVSMADRWTFIATNTHPNQFDSRLTSRFMDREFIRPVEVIGKDYRRTK